jgi:hypothetical protein
MYVIIHYRVQIDGSTDLLRNLDQPITIDNYALWSRDSDQLQRQFDIDTIFH